MSGGELLQKLEAIEAGAVAVAEIETQRVVADALEGQDLHVGEILLFAAAVLIAEDIFFSAGLGAGRGGAQLGSGEIRLGAVVPNDGDFVTDELDVLRRFHDGKIGAWAEPGRLVRHGNERAADLAASEDRRRGLFFFEPRPGVSANAVTWATPIVA